MTRESRSTALWTISLVAAAFGANSCRPDFAPYNRLTSLRVLGVQSEPPSPATNQMAELSALVYAPPGYPAPTYAWSWCPFTGPAADGSPCEFNGQPLDDATLAALLAEVRTNLQLPPGPPPPPLDLGTNPTAQLVNSIEPALLGAICDARLLGVLKPDCTGGFPFRIKLSVHVDGVKPDFKPDKVDTIFTARWPVDGVMTDNKNPKIEKLFAWPGGTMQEISDAPTLTLPRDTETRIEAMVLPEAAESYQGLDDQEQPTMLRERLFLTWFVETGDTDDGRTSFIDGRTPFEDLQKNKWTPGLQKDYAPDTARLFVVIHDSRGGASWKDGIVNLGPK